MFYSVKYMIIIRTCDGSKKSMGLSLKMELSIAPLKNAKLVILALLAHFMLIPAIAFILTWVIPLDESVRISLILLATAAGAPFLPKLAEVAMGNVAFLVGLMVLLLVVTIFYLPIVLPLLLGGVEVSLWDIAKSLIVMMLIPLDIGLFVNARCEEIAAKVQPTFGQVSNIAILVLTVQSLVLNLSSMIGMVGSCGILAGLSLSLFQPRLATSWAAPTPASKA